MGELTLRNMVEALSEVDDITWGRYAFSRDILCDRVDGNTKKEMIEKAIRCGVQKADEVTERFRTKDPEKLARALHLRVEYTDKGQTADWVLFALFTPPDGIEIMEEPIKKAAEQMPEIQEEVLNKLILGHEIFHYLEEEDRDIYTRTEKIELWRIFRFANRSTIRALSEIAAMSFTKSLNEFAYSPFIVDVLLYYQYYPEGARQIYRDVLKLSLRD